MAISFIYNGYDWRFEEGDPVLVSTVLEPGYLGHRIAVAPFIGEIETLATAGRYLYVRHNGKHVCVPWDGFEFLPGWTPERVRVKRVGPACTG